MLRVTDISTYLQLSPNETRELIRREGLAIDLGSRVVRVPRTRFERWLAERGA